MMFGKPFKSKLPQPHEALPGRAERMAEVADDEEEQPSASVPFPPAPGAAGG